MSIEIRLTTDQLDSYTEVLNKAKITFKARGNVIELTKDNVNAIVAALTAAHVKSLNLKTKNITHMERLYNLQNVLLYIDKNLHLLGLAKVEDEIVEATELPELDLTGFEEETPEEIEGFRNALSKLKPSDAIIIEGNADA